ncbi:MAG: glycosyltransferase family 39 protein [Candidatus Aenigmatarchaeota archaeon]
MTPIFSIFIFLLITKFRDIFHTFSEVKLQTHFILLLIFLLGFWFRNSEYSYGASFDGYFYVDTARTLYEKNLYAKGCAIGNLEFCRLYHQHLFPPAYPYLIYLLFVFFGEHDLFAMYISGILGSLTILLVFSITYLLFKDEEISLMAALIFAFVPLDIMISQTSAVRASTLFFISLTILFYLITLQNFSFHMFSLLAITFSLTIYMRQENSILLVPMIIGLFLFTNHKNLINQMKYLKFLKKEVVIPILLFLLTQIPVQHWILFNPFGFGAFRSLFSLQSLQIRLPYVINDFFMPQRWIQVYLFQPVISFLFIMSIPLIFYCYIKKDKIIWKGGLFLLIVFCLYFLLNLSYFLLGGRISGDYIRQIHAIVLPYSILSALSLLFPLKKFINKKFISFVIFIALTISMLPFIKINFSIFKDGRIEEEFTRDLIMAINTTPENSLVLISQSAVPTFDLIRNKERRWIDTNIIPIQEYRFFWDEINESKGRPIYFISNYGCEYGEEEELCTFIHKNFKLSNHTSIGRRMKVFKVEI